MIFYHLDMISQLMTDMSMHVITNIPCHHDLLLVFVIRIQFKDMIKLVVNFKHKTFNTLGDSTQHICPCHLSLSSVLVICPCHLSLSSASRVTCLLLEWASGEPEYTLTQSHCSSPRYRITCVIVLYDIEGHKPGQV